MVRLDRFLVDLPQDLAINRVQGTLVPKDDLVHVFFRQRANERFYVFV